MARLSELSLEQARALGAEFGLSVSSVEALDLGSVNSNFRFTGSDGAQYFARLYEEQALAGAQTEVRLLATLSEAQVPVVDPLSTKGGERVVSHRGKPFAIFPWVQGDWLCLGQVTPDYCHSLGAALARVHAASEKVGSLPEGRFRPSDMLARLERVERDGHARLAPQIASIRASYARYLPLRDVSLPRGVCHGDLFRDNVLWQGSRLSALLDFESAAWGNFSYDLMVTALAWCYRDALVLEHVKALFSGYASVRSLSADERAALPVEGALGCLRFATSRITDFELRAAPGAPPARDFRRFLSRLQAIEAGAFAPAWSSLGE
jgi:homoserine kinase type II